MIIEQSKLKTNFFKKFTQNIMEKVVDFIPDDEMQKNIMQKINEYKQTKILWKKIKETEKLYKELE